MSEVVKEKKRKVNHTVVNIDIETYNKIAIRARKSKRTLQGQIAWYVEHAPKEVIQP